MVRAHDSLPVTSAFQELVPAMGTDIVEGPDLIVLVANDKDILPQDFGGHIGAGLVEFADVASVLPGSKKQLFSLARQYVVIGIVPRR